MRVEMQNASGGGGGSLKDIIYDKVFNGGFATTYNITSYTGRSTVNEGKIAIDTDNKKGYLYVDMTATATFNQLTANATISPIPNSAYIPKNSSSQTITTGIPLYTDETSTNNKYLLFYYNATTPFIETYYPVNGDRYIAYGMWSYA